jgi:putative ABC transport system ATP-binding protein
MGGLSSSAPPSAEFRDRLFDETWLSPGKAETKGNPMFGTKLTQTAANVKPKNGRLLKPQADIRLQQVVKTYETAAGSFTALKNIDLEIKAGEFVAIVGKSGSGKSTLINMITGIDRPTTGEVWVGDTAVHTLSEGKMARWRGRQLGVIFQFFQLLPTLTVLENIMLPMDFCHMYSFRERRERAMHLLEQVEVADQTHKLPSALSGGQQQRVAIARALANDPPILVADEPTGNLDSKTSAAIFSLFENLVQRGKTVVMVTHDADLSNQVGRTITVSDGSIVSTTFVMQQAAEEESQQYGPVPV